MILEDIIIKDRNLINLRRNIASIAADNTCIDRFDVIIAKESAVIILIFS